MPFQPPAAPQAEPEADAKAAAAPAGTWRPEALYAALLLREVLRDPHVGILARWGPAAGRVRAVASAALELPEAQRPGTNLPWRTLSLLPSVCCAQIRNWDAYLYLMLVLQFLTRNKHCL